MATRGFLANALTDDGGGCPVGIYAPYVVQLSSESIGLPRLPLTNASVVAVLSSSSCGARRAGWAWVVLYALVFAHALQQ